MKTALFAGSFDPITNGHVEIIKNGAKIFDKIIIGVAYNYKKKGLIPVEKRLNLIKKSIKGIRNIEIYAYEGLTVDFAKKHNAQFLLRGLRNHSDFEYEKELANVNFKLNDSLRTIYLLASPEHEYISSATIRELVANNADISNFVPKQVKEYFDKYVIN